MTSKAVAFRVDASLKIGSGHVMRCLTLADRLKKNGLESHFICCQHDGHLMAMISEHGHRVYPIPKGFPFDNHDQDRAVSDQESWLGNSWQHDAELSMQVLDKLRAQWLVVDHYALDARWENELRDKANKMMVIDDLANRPHCCDLLLDQTFGRNASVYKDLVPGECALLLGTNYALLRPDFLNLRNYSLKRRLEPDLRHILVTMGGVDFTNATGRALDALEKSRINRGCTVTVVMGGESPWIESVRERANRLPFDSTVLVNVKEMADLMAEADLCIGAAGGTTWERCCLGLPTIAAVLADNQVEVARLLDDEKAAMCIFLDDSFELKLIESLNRLLDSRTELVRLSNAASRLVDGSGCDRVIESMCSQTL